MKRRQDKIMSTAVIAKGADGSDSGGWRREGVDSDDGRLRQEWRRQMRWCGWRVRLATAVKTDVIIPTAVDVTGGVTKEDGDGNHRAFDDGGNGGGWRQQCRVKIKKNWEWRIRAYRSVAWCVLSTCLLDCLPTCLIVVKRQTFLSLSHVLVLQYVHINVFPQRTDICTRTLIFIMYFCLHTYVHISYNQRKKSSFKKRGSAPTHFRLDLAA